MNSALVLVMINGIRGLKLLLSLAILGASNTALATPVVEQYVDIEVTSGVGLPELWYAMAEATGNTPDAAYEDAVVLQSEYSLDNAMIAVQLCPTDTHWVDEIAGGWVAVCGDANWEPVAFASPRGMLVGEYVVGKDWP